MLCIVSTAYCRLHFDIVLYCGTCNLLMRNGQKLDGLNPVLHNFSLDLRTPRCVGVLKSHGCLPACKYILGCSITTCDEPVLADLGFANFKI